MSAVRIETWEPVNFSREREHNRRDAGGDGRTAGRWENVPNFTETRVRFFPATVRTQHMHFRNVSTYCTQLKDQRAVWSLRSVIAEIIVICSLGRRSRAPLLCVSPLDIGPSSRSCGSLPLSRLHLLTCALSRHASKLRAVRSVAARRSGMSRVRPVSSPQAQ